VLRRDQCNACDLGGPSIPYMSLLAGIPRCLSHSLTMIRQILNHR
jgi:hypothetical protein